MTWASLGSEKEKSMNERYETLKFRHRKKLLINMSPINRPFGFFYFRYDVIESLIMFLCSPTFSASRKLCSTTAQNFFSKKAQVATNIILQFLI